MSSDVATIAALLAKAERTDNVHEAEAYLAKAQHLATLRSVDLAMVRARAARAAPRAAPVSRTVQVGEAGKRANAHLVSLYTAVARANDVLVDVAHNSTYVIGYGMPTDLELVERLWGSLAHQMVEAAGRYLETGEWRAQTYRRLVRRRMGGWSVPYAQDKPHTKQTARAAFYRGFIERIDHRLQQAREEAVEEARVTDRVQRGAGSGPRTEVVLQGKAAEVQQFHAQESQARGSWKGYRGAAAGDSGAAIGAGRRAAARAQLRSPRGVEGGGPSLPAP
jgi:hypothetical protein